VTLARWRQRDRGGSHARGLPDDAGAPVTTPAYRVEKLLEPAACQSCGWQLEPGESAVIFRGEIFCKRACVQKAIDGPFDVDLGGEG